MTNTDVQNQIKKLKNLPQYKNFTQEQFVEKAKQLLLKQTKGLDLTGLFDDTAEKKLAKQLVQKYLTDFKPRTVSEKNDLKSLLYLEIIQYRLQNLMNTHTKDKNGAVEVRMMKAVHENIANISLLKEKLGISSVDKGRALSDGLKNWELLQEKAKVWREENLGSRNMVCSYCGKMNLLRIKTDSYDTVKHPFFKDRWLANEHLVQLYVDRKISKQDVAKVLEVSTDYVEWLLKKWPKQKSKLQVVTEDQKLNETYYEEESNV